MPQTQEIRGLEAVHPLSKTVHLGPVLSILSKNDAGRRYFLELYDYIKPDSPIPPKPPDLFAGMGYSFKDRYPYSPNDSRLWVELYILASSVNHDMAVRLEYVRNTGAWLVLDDTYGFIIQPVIGQYGWESYEHYQREGQHQLSVYSQQVVRCLGDLRRRYDQGRIK